VDLTTQTAKAHMKEEKLLIASCVLLGLMGRILGQLKKNLKFKMKN
jgi:hypothetical protein